MKALLSPIGAIVYVDDILIGGRNEWEHDKSLRVVLNHLEMAGIHVNFNKI